MSRRFDTGKDPNIIQYMLNYSPQTTESPIRQGQGLDQEELARVLVARYATGSSGEGAATPRSEYDFRDRTN